MKILILVSEVNNRLKYVFDTIIKDRIYVDYELTCLEGYYLEYEGPRFVYGNTAIQGELYFEAVQLLNQKDIKNIKLDYVVKDNVGGIFPVSHGELHFDLFATSFYLITRYEEYLPHKSDNHGRFNVSDSLAYKHGFLKQPLIEKYASVLERILSRKFSGFKSVEAFPTLEVTLDIDNLYAYRYKGVVRTLGAIVKKIATLKLLSAIKHLCVLLGVMKDPYDSYDKLNEIHQKYGLRPIYFYLVRSKGKYDKNLDIKSNLVVNTLSKLKQQADIALHPSYESNNDIEILKEEKRLLEECVGREITKSRQHFIKMSFPKTYRDLISVGIKDDYSMGYATRVGFRASTSKPFLFFDLERDQVTELVVHPFYLMDTTMLKYMGMSGVKALRYAKKHLSDLYSYSNVGVVFLFHNESILGKGLWDGWGEVYDQMIKYVVETKKK